MKKLRKAVIPAAGLGTRFLPATKAIPKEMLPIVDKPTIQYIVEEAVASGLEDILFVTSLGKSAIADHFDYNFELDVTLNRRGRSNLAERIHEISHMISVATVRQKEPLGLGHAVLVTEPYIGNEPFCVFLGDDIIESEVPAMKQMIDIFERHSGSVLAVQEVSRESVSSYGVVDAQPIRGEPGVFRVSGLIEKPTPEEAPSNLAIIGRYILTPGIFESLGNTKPGAIGEIQLTDGIEGLLEDGEQIFACKFQGTRFDAGDKLGFLQANVQMALKRDDIGEAFRNYLKSLKL